MPRLARLDALGLLHHVMIRGIEREKIFKDDKDRENLFTRLGDLLPKTDTVCYAWVFMSNHAHFLFRSGPAGLPHFMQRLLTGYVVTFNRRHNRHGQLFQNRYKSIVCQEDIYLKELVRYIHLNPVRAKIVPDIKALNDYYYSGHSAIMGRVQRPWQDTEYILKAFAHTKREAKKRYLEFVNSGIGQGRRDDLVGGGLVRSLGGWTEIRKIGRKNKDRIKGDERILGDGGFVDRILSQAKDMYERRYELKRLGYDFNKVCEIVCGLFQMDIKSALARGRQQDKVIARSLICFWSVSELKMTVSELAKIFNQSPSTISYAVERGKEIAEKNGFKILP
jgi:REP element-mobilizing transposase RayT